MSELTICLSYYNQSKDVLMRHIDCWKNYSQTIKDKIEFIIIDDCSKIEMKELLKNEDITSLNLHLYRVEDDLYCNIAGVRNLSAKVSNSEWILFLDMDTLVENKMIIQVFEIINKNQMKRAYKFNRIVPGNENSKLNGKIHPGVCLIRKKDYWKIGGNEEDLVGHYGGTDVSFWVKAKFDKHDRIVNVILCNNIYITYISEGEADIVRDATHNFKLIDQRKRDWKWSTNYVRFKWYKIN